MKLDEVPEEYKIYTVKVMSGEEYYVTGEELNEILKAKEDLIRLKTGNGFNKKSIMTFKINVELTRESVQKNKPKLLTK